MFKAFISYFFRYIFMGKNKQRLLLMALVGLCISSFSLFVLESSMGGLQRNLIKRSKRVLGTGVIELKNVEKDFGIKVLDFVHEKKLTGFLELEMELLLRNENYINPVVVHGLDYQKKLPSFLKDLDIEESIIGSDLAQKMRVSYATEVLLISPSHTNMMMTDIPRHVTTMISDVVRTEVPEIDMYHFWTKDQNLFSLIRDYQYNIIRLYSSFDKKELANSLEERFPSQTTVKTWEDQNESLVWALNLETTVMMALFIMMTILIGVAITSGLLIFFSKIQLDLVSFWMLGLSKNHIDRLSFRFLNLLGLLSSLSGIVLGAIFLYFLERYSDILMPDVFIEKKIPVYITLKRFMIAFGIPYIIALFFSWISLRSFKKDTRSFTARLRSVH